MKILLGRLKQMGRSKTWRYLMGILFAAQLPCASAAINWPSTQLLPSFSQPAQTQDLIILREDTLRWEAEGSSIGHKTGRLEGDGWLCQTGIDAANDHMVYGPYATNVPAGPNVAEFRMKIDNNTADDNVVVTIDVRNATTGAILASQNVTRRQFPIAGDYTSINLPFTMPAENQSLELRVFWTGASYIKVDWVGVQRNQSADEMVLFASLKGIVNLTQPRIFSYEGDAFAEGPYTWLQSLGLGWTEYGNKWDLIGKYRNEISGIIVYDNAQPDTINYATTVAASRKALVASPGLVSRLTSAPYNFPILVDYRGQFSSKISVYQRMYNELWPTLTRRLLIGLNPNIHRAAFREYAVAVGAATIWLDPKIPEEKTLLDSFLSSMQPGAVYMGWWPEEGPGVEAGSRWGISTVASDWASNITMHSGMPRTVTPKPMPAKPALQNKIYVAFILSDGDNLQYVEHLMRKLWNNPDRGRVPMGWTLSPAMIDAMPAALNYYWQTSTTNDALISGPSGYGYIYPNFVPNDNQLRQFIARTEEYNKRAGFRVVTIWNTITGGIDTRVGNMFANAAPSLLGMTAQNTGGGLTIYNNKLPGQALSCNYCTNEQAMKDHIASAAAGWNRNEPRFVIIQAQPWTDVTPTRFLNVANSLNADYSVVRPDTLFQLLREARGLPVNPTNLVQVYQHCNYDGWVANFSNGSFNTTAIVNAGGVNKDASSLRIAPGYKVTLYPEDNFTGTPVEVTGDVPCLVGNNFNDRLSSMVVSPITGSSSSAVSSSRSSSSSVVSSSRSSVASSIVSSSRSSVASSIASNCTSPQYVNGGTYATGALVQNVGNEYQCTVGGWCTIGGPYEPGVGWAWTNAWSLVRSCR